MEGTDAVVEKIEGHDEFVGGDVSYVALGYKGRILGVSEWVSEEDDELVEHQDHP